MFLHAGNNKTIRETDIIGIFDADTATVDDTTKDFLRRAEKLYSYEGQQSLLLSDIDLVALRKSREKINC